MRIKVWQQIVTVSAAEAGAVSSLFGGWDAMLSVLAAEMVID